MGVFSWKFFLWHGLAHDPRFPKKFIINYDPNNEKEDLFVMLVLKMAMHATVEMQMTSLFRLTLQSVTSHALAILVNSVAAHGVCKYMIPNIHQLQLNRPMFWC